MEDQIVRVVEEYECDFFRLDCNFDYLQALRIPSETATSRTRTGATTRRSTAYSTAWRALSRTDLENCGAGGGRTDIGLMKRFSHTWVTDWMMPPRAFQISNGMTMALPPEYIDRIVGTKDATSTSNVPGPVWSPDNRPVLEHRPSRPDQAHGCALQRLCQAIHRHE